MSLGTEEARRAPAAPVSPASIPCVRTANQFIAEIREQSVLADKLGYNSAWIGEHHFDTLGMNWRPDQVLASIISETKTPRPCP